MEENMPNCIRKNVNHQQGECIMDEHIVKPVTERNITQDSGAAAKSPVTGIPCMLPVPFGLLRLLYAVWQFNRTLHDFPRLPMIHGIRNDIRKDKEHR